MFIVAAVVMYGTAVLAQNAQLIKAYRSGKSALDQATEIEGKFKPRSLTPMDHLAQEKILYQANPKRVTEIKGDVRESEALTPSMITAMDSTYPDPKLSEWYPEIAAQQGWDSVFRFTAEPFPAIGFEYLTDKAYREYAEPNAEQKKDAEQMLRYLTIRVQQDLWKSDYVYLQEIPRLLEERNNLWLLLPESLKDYIRDDRKYCEFWRQQEQCYLHKFRSHWDCSCPEKAGDIPDTSTCGTVKDVIRDKDQRDLDAPTQIWIRINYGDLTAVQDALNLGYGTWGNVRDHLIPQAIFFDLATRNRQMITLVRKTKTQRNKNDLLNDQMKLSLVKLYRQSKALGDSKYYDRIGLTDSMVMELQDYYRCILHVETIDDTVPKLAERDTKSQADGGIKRKDPLKPNSTVPNANQAKEKEKGSTTTTIIRRLPANAKLDLKKISPILQDELQDELDLHDALHACVQVEAIDDSTLEIKVSGCGLQSKGIFKVLETDNPITADFYDVCGNKVYLEVIKPFKEKFGGSLKVKIIGTADTLGCITCNNDTLAQRRANGVADHLGPKMVEAVGGRKAIDTEGRTNDLERKAVIQVQLLYKKKR